MRHHLVSVAVLTSVGVASCGGGTTTGSAASGPSSSATTSSGTGGSGGSTSSSGWSGSGGDPAPEDAPPRAIGPLSTSTVTSQTPTFHWELSGQWDGARVEICTDRTCSTAKTLDAVGTSAKPAKALSPGLWYYRIYGDGRRRL